MRAGEGLLDALLHEAGEYVRGLVGIPGIQCALCGQLHPGPFRLDALFEASESSSDERRIAGEVRGRRILQRRKAPPRRVVCCTGPVAARERRRDQSRQIHR